MSKEFKQGNTYVFTTKNYRKSHSNREYRTSISWVNECNGREVIIGSKGSGTCLFYIIHADWCKCIKVGTK